MLYTGSCLCGDVGFEINGEFESFYLCHCKYCQKDTGSAHASNLFSSKAQLVWLTGEKKVKSYQVPSTQHVRSFCTNCGSAVPNMQMDGQMLVVPAGCLNQNISIKPTAHIYQASAADWAKNLDDIKVYEQLPE